MYMYCLKFPFTHSPLNLVESEIVWCHARQVFRPNRHESSLPRAGDGAGLAAYGEDWDADLGAVEFVVEVEVCVGGGVVLWAGRGRHDGTGGMGVAEGGEKTKMEKDVAVVISSRWTRKRASPRLGGQLGDFTWSPA